MIGLYPIVRNKAFDMVSDGQEFKLSVPATNKFYIGHNQVRSQDSSSPLDTLRPAGDLRRPAVAGGQSRERNRRAGEQHRNGGGRADPQAGAAAQLCPGRDPARPTRAGRWRERLLSTAPTWYLIARSSYDEHGEPGHRRQLSGIQRLRRRQFPQLHRRQAAAGRVRHSPDHGEAYGEPAHQRGPVRSAAAAGFAAGEPR